MEFSGYGGDMRRYVALVCLLLNAGCITAAELLLKVGALRTAPEHPGILGILGISALQSWYTVGGILCYVTGFALWLYALKVLPLSLAFSFTTIQQATVVLGSWYFLGDRMPPLRVVGICVLMLGVLLLVPAIVTAEKKTDAPDEQGGGLPA